MWTCQTQEKGSAWREPEDAENKKLAPIFQIWDFAGQQENLLYFHQHGIYAIVCHPEGVEVDPFSALRFWLWAVSQYTTDSHDSGKPKEPPIIVICTHWKKNQVREAELNQCIQDLCQQLPQLKRQLLLGLMRKPDEKQQPQRWFFPVENLSAADSIQEETKYFGPLRKHLEEVARIQLGIGTQKPKTHVAPAACRASYLFEQLAAGINIQVQSTALCDGLTGGPNMPAEKEKQRLLKKLAGKTSAQKPFVAPEGASVEWHEKEIISMRRDHPVAVKVSCNFLSFEHAKVFLYANIQEFDGDVAGILRVLHCQGKLFWLENMPEKPVVLNVSAMAAAIGNLESPKVCEKKLSKKKLLRTPDGARFTERGIMSHKLLDALFSEFDDAEKKLLRDVMVHKGTLMKRIEGEFAVPSCLPIAHLPDPPQGECIISYVEMEGSQGFVPLSMSFFPRLASQLCSSQSSASAQSQVDQLAQPEQKLRLGPPQIFRNRMEFLATAAMSVSMFPPRASNPKLLRFVFQQANEKQSQHVIRSLFAAIGFYGETSGETETWSPIKILRPEELSKVGSLRHVQWPEAKDPEEFIREKPCLDAECDGTCQHCKVPRLLQERFLNDLSTTLQKIMQTCSVDQTTPARPSGSFRYKSIKFPGDVDIEEYVTVKASSKTDALTLLAGLLTDLCSRGNRDVHWGGLKAGKDPQSQKYLTWSREDVMRGEKSGQSLAEALEVGHNSWTAKLDFFGTTSLFKDAPHGSDPKRVYEVTNVIRLGFDKGDGIVHQVTREKDFLGVVEKCMMEYSGPQPKMMKFATLLKKLLAFWLSLFVDICMPVYLLAQICGAQESDGPVMDVWLWAVSCLGQNLWSCLASLKIGIAR